MVCKQVIIKGRVQGVFFRASAKAKADELGLGGEVRNLPDGSVEIIVSGAENFVEQMIEWCKLGPARAEVREVQVSELPVREFEDFTIVRRQG